MEFSAHIISPQKMNISEFIYMLEFLHMLCSKFCVILYIPYITYLLKRNDVVFNLTFLVLMHYLQSDYSGYKADTEVQFLVSIPLGIKKYKLSFHTISRLGRLRELAGASEPCLASITHNSTHCTYRECYIPKS